MGKMVRFLIVLSLSGMAAAQDIAPPAVPDLNRDTEEGRVRERNRKEIRSFLAQLCLVRNLPSFEVIIRGGNGLATEFYQVILGGIPGKCPETLSCGFSGTGRFKKEQDTGIPGRA